MGEFDEQTIAELFAVLDVDGDGYVTFDEFVERVRQAECAGWRQSRPQLSGSLFSWSRRYTWHGQGKALGAKEDDTLFVWPGFKSNVLVKQLKPALVHIRPLACLVCLVYVVYSLQLVCTTAAVIQMIHSCIPHQTPDRSP